MQAIGSKHSCRRERIYFVYVTLLLIPFCKGFLCPVSACMCVCFMGEGLFHTSNPQMPAGCPKIQPSSHAVYPEGESDLTGKGLSPVRPSTADPKAGHRLEVSGTSSLGFIHWLGWFTELTFWSRGAALCGRWDLHFPARDSTWAPAVNASSSDH